MTSTAHIDPARIVPFDIFQDPRRAADGNPFAMVSKLRAEGAPGMFWTPMHGGHWVIQDFELAFDAVRDPELFSSFNTRIPASEVNSAENNIFQFRSRSTRRSMANIACRCRRRSHLRRLTLSKMTSDCLPAS